MGRASGGVVCAVVSAASDVLATERNRFEARTGRSRERFERALAVHPGGDTRIATFYEPYPVVIQQAEGIDLVDLDGNHYADFLLNYTSLITGHRHASVMAAAAEAMSRLTGVAAPVPGQVELAEELIARVDGVDRVRFTNSGSESTLLALWAARAFTSRPIVIKTIGGYHGCVPELDRSLRTGSFPPGLPENTPARAVPFNDQGALKDAIDEAGSALAAVLVEPVLGSGGVVAPEPGFLEKAREWTRDVGALLIFDEVITFRLSRGGYQEVAGVEPDLTAFAKIIGGGFPVGAIGGSADVMEVFRPGGERSISHSGTFNGNPVTVAAGLKVLELLDDAAYAKLDSLGDRLAHGLRAAIEKTGVPAQVTHVGSLLNVHFTREPVRDFDSAQTSDPVAAAAFHLGLLNRGVFVAPRGMFALSIVTNESDVEKAVVAAGQVFAALWY
jgi:glutamate-1-semialdehyde 2,1-aminomutase